MFFYHFLIADSRNNNNNYYSLLKIFFVLCFVFNGINGNDVQYGIQTYLRTKTEKIVLLSTIKCQADKTICRCEFHNFITFDLEKKKKLPRRRWRIYSMIHKTKTRDVYQIIFLSFRPFRARAHTLEPYYEILILMEILINFQFFFFSKLLTRSNLYRYWLSKLFERENPKYDVWFLTFEKKKKPTKIFFLL